MVEGGGGIAFPVIFFDGEREINIGLIQVHPMLQYKAFQLMLSQRIGISPNQISIYLVDRKNSKSSDDRRKIPITGKSNFALICREKGICFFVVLKRSRKARSRKARPNGGDYFHENDFSPSPPPQPENVILLRRNQAPEVNFNPNSPRFSAAFYDRIAPAELASLNERLQNLRIQRENYAMAMAKPNLNPNDFPRIEDIYSSITMAKKSDGKVFFCKECENVQKNDDTATFHHCVNDDKVVGFRSRAGPIGWPIVKSSH